MPTSIFSPDNILNSEVELPEDSSTWSQKISEILFSVHPELAQFPSKLSIDKFEPMKLYAKGTYIFNINGKTLIVPIIVKAKKLQPLDVALIDDRWQYLTPELIQSMELTTNIGEGTDNTSGFYQENVPLRGTRVPYETVTSLNPGVEFSEGGRYITASAKSIKNLEERLKVDTKLASALSKNTTARKVFENIMSNKQLNVKCAAFTRKDINTVTTHLKLASGEVIIEDKPTSKVKALVTKLAGDSAYNKLIKTGFAAMPCMHAGISASLPDMLADAPSMIKDLLPKITSMLEQGPAGLRLLEGGDIKAKPAIVIKIKRVTSPISPLMGDSKNLGALFEDGKFKLLKDDALATEPTDKPGIKTETMAEADPDSMSEGDNILPLLSDNEALEPIKVEKVVTLPIGKAIIGKATDSGSRFVGIMLNRYDSKLAADVDNLMESLPKEGREFLPPTTRFIKISEASLITNRAEYKHLIKKALIKQGSKTHDLYYLGNGEYRLDDNYILGDNNIKAAMMLLNMSEASADVLIKEANAKKYVKIYTHEDSSVSPEIIKKIKTAADWAKIASVIDDTEESVDSVLSLGLLDNENEHDKDEILPLLDSVESKLVKLLVAARLGAQNLDKTELLDAIKALQEVSNSLKM